MSYNSFSENDERRKDVYSLWEDNKKPLLALPFLVEQESRKPKGIENLH